MEIDELSLIEHQINLSFCKDFRATLTIADIDKKKSEEETILQCDELTFHSVFPAYKWNKYALPLLYKQFPIINITFNYENEEKFFLLWKDNQNFYMQVFYKGSRFLFMLNNCAIFLAQCIQDERYFESIGSVNVEEELMTSSKLTAKERTVKESCSSYRKLLFDKLRKEQKEKTKLIIKRTQSQLTPSQSITASDSLKDLPKLPKPSQGSSESPCVNENMLKGNKERLKRYMLYELAKTGISKEHPEFNEYWRSLYSNCQFKLRKELSSVEIKRDVLFNCVKNCLKAMTVSV